MTLETYEKWQRQFETNHNTLMCSTVMLTIKTVSPTGYMFPGGELAEGLMDCRPVTCSHWVTLNLSNSPIPTYNLVYLLWCQVCWDYDSQINRKEKLITSADNWNNKPSYKQREESRSEWATQSCNVTTENSWSKIYQPTTWKLLPYSSDIYDRRIANSGNKYLTGSHFCSTLQA